MNSARCSTEHSSVSRKRSFENKRPKANRYICASTCRTRPQSQRPVWVGLLRRPFHSSRPRGFRPRKGRLLVFVAAAAAASLKWRTSCQLNPKSLELNSFLIFHNIFAIFIVINSTDIAESAQYLKSYWQQRLIFNHNWDWRRWFVLVLWDTDWWAQKLNSSCILYLVQSQRSQEQTPVCQQTNQNSCSLRDSLVTYRKCVWFMINRRHSKTERSSGLASLGPLFSSLRKMRAQLTLPPLQELLMSEKSCAFLYRERRRRHRSLFSIQFFVWTPTDL